MRRITNQLLKPIIIVWFCHYVLITNCDENLLADSSKAQISVKMKNSVPPPNDTAAEISKIDLDKQKTVEKNSNNVKAVFNDSSLGLKQGNNDKSNDVKSHITLNNTGNSTTGISKEEKPAFNGFPQPINLGALQRGIYVFLGLSVIVVAYIIFRCTRLSKNRTQMIRKYGVLAHRQDVEMRPLPLDDEDEDDTTVFDASEVGVHNKRHERI